MVVLSFADHSLDLFQQHLALPAEFPLAIPAPTSRFGHRPAKPFTILQLALSLSLRLFIRFEPFLCCGFPLISLLLLPCERFGFGLSLISSSRLCCVFCLCILFVLWSGSGLDHLLPGWMAFGRRRRCGSGVFVFVSVFVFWL